MTTYEQFLVRLEQTDEDQEQDQEADIPIEFVDLPKLESNLNERMKSLGESKNLKNPILAHVLLETPATIKDIDSEFVNYLESKWIGFSFSTDSKLTDVYNLVKFYSIYLIRCPHASKLLPKFKISDFQCKILRS